MKKILIAGCGELGSRFLQAAVTLKEISEIDIVEPGEKARETAAKRMNEMGRDMLTLTVNWFSDLDEVTSSGDMVVIATQADVRLAVFEKILAKGYRNFLVEKIVTQSEKDYTRMMQLADQHKANVWVNCKTRNYPIWEYIKTKIDPADKLVYHSIGGNHGICTNGLHTTDLFVFLTNAEKLNIVAERFDKKLTLTKRGKYDVSGQLQFENPANKSTLLLDYEATHTQMPMEILMTDKYRWVVDNSTRQGFESSVAGDVKLTPIPFEGDVSVSVMSIGFIADILKNNTCELPTLAECFAAHKAIFNATLPLFNELLGKNDDNCPIT
jgi:predicted dehydrogenase